LSDVGLDLLDRDYVGRFDANLSLAGVGPALTGEAVMRLTGAGGRDLKGVPPVDGAIKAALARGALTLDAEFTDAKGLDASASSSFPPRRRPPRSGSPSTMPLRSRAGSTSPARPSRYGPC